MTSAGKWSSGAKSRSSSRAAADQPDASARDGGDWSEAELRHLRERYQIDSDEDLAQALERSTAAVQRMAAKLFADSLQRQTWTVAEVDQLKAELGSAEPGELAVRLRRTPAELDAKLRELESNPRSGSWTRDEIAQIKRLYGRRTDRDLARILQRSPESIRRMARRFALAKDKAFLRQLEGTAVTRMPRWTAEELQRLVELYPGTPNLEIAHLLQRSVKSVVSKAHHMQLKKCDERLREMGRENVARRSDRG